ncbi:MAG: hypothetical protein WC788_00335 [Candidatus Paceibacterota bacterium]
MKNEGIVNVNSSSEDPIERILDNSSAHRFWIGREWMPRVDIFIEWLKFPEGDPMRSLIMKATPLEARLLGASAKNDFVYWRGKRIVYDSDAHHELIARAMRSKYRDNPDAMEALLSTGKKTITHEADSQGQDTSLPKELFCKTLTAIRKENAISMKELVVMKYADNTCCVQVVSVKEAMEEYDDGFFGIDLAKRIWKFGRREFRIGSRRSCERGSRGGVIGVYNRRSIDHIDSLAHTAIDAVSADHIWNAD